MIDVDFYKESVPILRYRLCQLGLDYKGTKKDLVQRLVAASTQDQDQSLEETFHASTGNSIVRGASKERPCKGILIHNSVWITQREHMMELGSTLSGFGKGSLSRSVPVFGTEAPEALKGKVARQRTKLTRQRESLEIQVARLDSENSHRALVSSSEGDILAVDIGPLLSSPTKDNIFEEHLQLCLWEAFYASFISKQLNIFDKTDPITKLTDPDRTYAYFCRLIPHFPYYLAIYCYYKERGWSPHSGLKYVDIHKDDSPGDCLLEKSWISLQNRLRLVKQVAKQLLLVHVQKPKGLADEILFSRWESCLSLEISEMRVERWTALNKRRKKDGRV
ncbi:tRNA-splicing endonuclease subunit Sen2 [Galdieria sulphuraria]|nr:tRNA-splicing endonuclease subunit Sen2 [Galdieria sulphuraria]